MLSRRIPIVLRDELRDAINRVSAENGSNTPDLILANFLQEVLEAFDEAVRGRDLWYGVSLGPRNLSNPLRIGSVGLMHANQAHPDFEYAMTEGPRKYWDRAKEPPPGEGWERNVHIGEYGWRRLDFVEQAFWMRRKPAVESSDPDSQTLMNIRPDVSPQPQFEEYLRGHSGSVSYIGRKENREVENEEEVSAPGKGSDSGEGDSEADYRD
jgi:hypothetical protein